MPVRSNQGTGAWERAAGIAAPFDPQTGGADSKLKSARVVILTGGQQSYRQAAESLRNLLKDRTADCRIIELPADTDTAGKSKAIKQLQDASPTVVAATGMAAAITALDAAPTASVVSFMTPNAQDVLLPDSDKRRARLTCVAADVSPEQQLEWIHAVHPKCARLAVLYSGRTAKAAAALKRAAAARRIELHEIEADKDKFPKAMEALAAANCDGVLMLPDAAVYNGANVEHMLLWGLRNKRAVWGFSSNVVKAGAFAGQFVDADAVARETFDVVGKVASGIAPESIGVIYPQKVTRAVNERTSRMIDIVLSASALEGDTQKFGDSK